MLKKIIISSCIALAFLMAIAMMYAFIISRPNDEENIGKAEDAESEKARSLSTTSFAEIMQQVCEHRKAIVECDMCRYEAGLVKIHPSLSGSQGSPSKLIKVEMVREEAIPRTIEATGEIQPDLNRILTIRSKTAGVISSIKADLGYHVKRGQMLFEMDSSEYEELHLEFTRLQALLKLAQRNFEREDRLFQKKLTTEKEFLEAQSEVERIRIELDVVKGKLLLMGLSNEEILELPEHTQNPRACLLPVRSPLDGAVVAREVTPGELVEANANLATIADFSTLWVWVDIYEKDLGMLQLAYTRRDVTAEISASTYPGRIFTGRLDYLADQMDERTRTVKARVSIPNEGKLLKSGMFVRCKLVVSHELPTLAIPQEALMSDGDERFVFKQVGDDLFFKQAVQAGELIASRIAIISGLQANDRIVTQGAFALKSDVLREKMGAGCAD